MNDQKWEKQQKIDECVDLLVKHATQRIKNSKCSECGVTETKADIEDVLEAIAKLEVRGYLKQPYLKEVRWTS